MMGYRPFSLCVIHKEDLCPCSRVIYRLMMIIRSVVASRKDISRLMIMINNEKVYIKNEIYLEGSCSVGNRIKE
jgi:hypothetical protein